jgi:hypothetical protein
MIDDLSRVTDQARAGTRVDGTHRPSNRGERAAVTSQGYLTHGLTARLAELKAHVDHLDRVDPGPRDRAVLGAIITLDNGEHYALLPGGQGVRIEVDSTSVVVLSRSAPLAQALQGLEIGDTCDWRGREIEIADIH